MLTAITRGVGPCLGDCELSFLPREPIEIEKAREQHRAYERWLKNHDVRVHALPPEADLPDAVFVEDPAIVVDELAVITSMGVESRRKEHESLAQALASFRPLKFLSEPARLEGGDCLRVGRNFYVGLSRRTNRAGLDQLTGILKPYGYHVQAVEVEGCLHLKTACSYVGRKAVLANRAWANLAPIEEEFEIIEVPKSEPWAANVLRVGEALLLPEGFPKTRALLLERGFQVETIDVSELIKAEAGLTCMSLIFNSSVDQ